MAIIKCPHCGKEISDYRTFCPYCKKRIKKASNSEQEQDEIQTVTESPTPKQVEEEYDEYEDTGGGFQLTHEMVTKFGVIAFIVVIILAVFFGGKENEKQQQQALMQRQQEEVRVKQEAEMRARQEAEAQRAFMSRFVGTYYFIDRNEKPNKGKVFAMLEDGRIFSLFEHLQKRGHYSATYIGNAYFISQYAFTITGADVHLHIYFDNCKFYGGVPYNHPNYFYADELIFDINDKKVYISRAEYNNRDVAKATHLRFIHESSFPTIINE